MRDAEDADRPRSQVEPAGAGPAKPTAEVMGYGKQPCLQCDYPISEVAGSKAAICANCGFKDPCC